MTQQLFRTLASDENPLQRAVSGPLWAAASLVAFVVSAARDGFAAMSSDALSGARLSRPKGEA